MDCPSRTAALAVLLVAGASSSSSKADGVRTGGPSSMLDKQLAPVEG